MLTRLFRIWAGLASVAIVAAMAAAACDLNPQPLPPGDSAFSGSGAASDGGSVAAQPTPGGNDDSEAGTILAAGDGGPAGFAGGSDGGDAEATDAGDGGDAGEQDAGDAGDADTHDASSDADQDAE